MKLRNLLESIEITENISEINNSRNPLKLALMDFIGLLKDEVPYVLIGGLAVGFRARPRATQDIDILLNSDEDIKKVFLLVKEDFKKHRSHAIEHRDTGVEIELLTPEFLSIKPEIVKATILDATIENKVRVVTKEGLVALKLLRGTRRDQGDIEDIIRQNGHINLEKFDLSDDQMKLYQEIEDDIQKEKK